MSLKNIKDQETDQPGDSCTGHDRLLSELSRSFLEMQVGKLDSGVEQGLKELCETVAARHASYLEFDNEGLRQAAELELLQVATQIVGAAISRLRAEAALEMSHAWLSPISVSTTPRDTPSGVPFPCWIEIAALRQNRSAN